jgi:uncharacterized cupin superfamily protein
MPERRCPPMLDPGTVPPRKGSVYQHPFTGPLAGRVKRALGDALGLGDWSSPRHWHSHEDEFVFVLDGELTLVTSAGEQVLEAGMAAGFPAGVEDGHHLINHSDATVTYLEVGSRQPQDVVRYPDIDLMAESGPGGRVFTNKQGEPY